MYADSLLKHLVQQMRSVNAPTKVIRVIPDKCSETCRKTCSFECALKISMEKRVAI